MSVSTHRSSIHTHVTGKHGHHSTPSEGKLLHSAFDGDHTEVVHAIQEGVDINCVNDDGETPLHLAAKAGQLHISTTLVTRGANINARDNSGETPLHNATDANHPHMVEILLKAGADVHATDVLGWTPLHNAAGCGDHSDIVEMLLRKGADPFMETLKGKTPKDLAEAEDHEESAILLGAVMAAESGNTTHFYESSPFTSDNTDIPKTPELQLCLAAFDGNIDKVDALLARHVSVNCRGEEFNTPLHRAAQMGQLPVVQRLITEKANVKLTNKDTETALHLACEENHPKITKLLLESGASVNAVDHLGWTPLQNIVQAGDYTDVLDILLQNGADTKIKNNDGHTALDIAQEEGHLGCIKTLSEY